MNNIEQLESLLSTVVELFEMDGSKLETTILINSIPNAEPSECSEWGYTLYLAIPLSLYYQIEDKMYSLQRKILNKFNSMLRGKSEYFEEVLLVPQTPK